MSYRVIQWSTGNVGAFALRTIIEHPALELVGVGVHAEAKAGKDAGELCGLGRVGVRATRGIDATLAIDADCVCYTASGDTRPEEAIDDICRFLAAGRNVVSTSVVALVHPRTFDPVHSGRLADACREGGSSFFNSGIDPGFANDILPLLLSGLCGHWSEIRIQEIINYSTYDRPEILYDVMGFGGALDETPLLLLPGVLTMGWGGTIRLLAEGLGLELDEIRESHERLPAVRPITIGDYTIKPGSTAALRFEVQGIVDGRAAIVVDHVTRLDDDLAPEWPSGSGSYRVLIKGVPSMRCDFEFADEHGDHAVGGVLLTATRVVNAIPSVCEAPSGLLSVLDLPLITGKGLLR